VLSPIGAQGSAAKTKLGLPPAVCGEYEYLKNFTCVIQSRAMTFTLSPHTPKPGELITATTSVIFDSPGNGAPAVSWSWDSLAILGARQPGCGPEKGSSGLTSRCTFKVGSATSEWRTVTLSFSTYVGPAQSRDFFAVVSDSVIDGTVMRRAKPEDKAATKLVPAAGVRVRIGDGSAVTNTAGYFIREMPNKGSFEVSAGPAFCVKGGSGCQAAKTVKVPSGGTVDFEQEVPFEVSGTVKTTDCGSSGCKLAPLANVTVRATGGDGGGSAVTDAAGKYTLEVPKGSWRIAPEEPGSEFAPDHRDVNVAGGNVDGVDFQTCANSRATSGVKRVHEGPLCRRFIVDTQRPADYKQIKGKPVRFRFEGVGWDPKGPITVSWGGKVAERYSGVASFNGAIAAEWPQRDRSGCHGVVAATQGKVTRAQVLQSPPAGVVVFADNDLVLRTGDPICGGESYLPESTRGTVVMSGGDSLLYVYQGDGSRVGGAQSPRLCVNLFPKSRGHVTITQLQGGRLQIARAPGAC
jgi:hypothetical protein